ncbi:MAG TPA: DUF2716 domain-containing protein [Marmoricola sp.]|jgi:hypothetical protein|nr:DUF2716 domain-containing protein [Marmoricola sp.]
MSERFAEPPQAAAWVELNENDYRHTWSRFSDRFSFRASTTPDGWPAIKEPTPSVTFDLSTITDGPQRGAAYDAINTEAVRAFVWALPDIDYWLALDWQHPAYRFRPSVHALTWKPDWAIPVYPDGDYFSFLTPDMTCGTFGHPWERTLCVFGEPLVQTLGLSLGTWLPTKRRSVPRGTL